MSVRPGGNSRASARGRGFIRAFHLDAEGLKTVVHHQGGDDVGAFPAGGDHLDVVGHPEFVGEGDALAVLEAARRNQTSGGSSQALPYRA